MRCTTFVKTVFATTLIQWRPTIQSRSGCTSRRCGFSPTVTTRSDIVTRAIEPMFPLTHERQAFHRPLRALCAFNLARTISSLAGRRRASTAGKKLIRHSPVAASSLASWLDLGRIALSPSAHCPRPTDIAHCAGLIQQLDLV
jgi:hypothetical protein